MFSRRDPAVWLHAKPLGWCQAHEVRIVDVTGVTFMLVDVLLRAGIAQVVLIHKNGGKIEMLGTFV